MKADGRFWRGFRAVLAAAARVEPSPKPGEAWCQQCTLNDGATLTMPADLIYDHLRLHIGEPGSVRIKVSGKLK